MKAYLRETRYGQTFVCVDADGGTWEFLAPERALRTHMRRRYLQELALRYVRLRMIEGKQSPDGSPFKYEDPAQ
jgi:hypothetical protein